MLIKEIRVDAENQTAVCLLFDFLKLVKNKKKKLNLTFFLCLMNSVWIKIVDCEILQSTELQKALVCPNLDNFVAPQTSLSHCTSSLISDLEIGLEMVCKLSLYVIFCTSNTTFC